MIKFENLNLASGEIKLEVLQDNDFCVQVSGTVQLIKGSFKQSFNWSASVQKSVYKGYLNLYDDDMDVCDTMIGDILIDNIDDFRAGLRKNGMQTFANSLEFKSDERKSVMYKLISDHPIIKTVFGCDIIFDSLSPKEKKIVMIDRVINNYDSLGDHYKRCAVDSYDGTEVPTLEEIIEYKNNLK